jgi:hypothetical protein
VDRLGGQRSAYIGMFFENSVRPIGEADFLFGDGMRLRQNEYRCPSESSLGELILDGAGGETQILACGK